ncbi:MAG: hypothetical protein IJI73_09050 [Kiritimatiellae bacterium]|nr:hypothetical protein [Kiritimatiellia bacterium]
MTRTVVISFALFAPLLAPADELINQRPDGPLPPKPYADGRLITTTLPTGAKRLGCLNADGTVAATCGDLSPREVESHGVDAVSGLSWTERRVSASTNEPSVFLERTYENAFGDVLRTESAAPHGKRAAVNKAFAFTFEALVCGDSSFLPPTPPVKSTHDQSQCRNSLRCPGGIARAGWIW